MPKLPHQRGGGLEDLDRNFKHHLNRANTAVPMLLPGVCGICNVFGGKSPHFTHYKPSGPVQSVGPIFPKVIFLCTAIWPKQKRRKVYKCNCC